MHGSQPVQGASGLAIGPNVAPIAGIVFDEDTGIESLKTGFPRRFNRLPQSRCKDPFPAKALSIVQDPPMPLSAGNDVVQCGLLPARGSCRIGRVRVP